MAAADVKSLLRWGTRQGLPGALIRVGARRGDHFARLAADPALRADPFAFYDRIRAAGPVVPGMYALATARHDVISEIVRAEEFRSGFPEETLPRPVRRALGWADDPAARGPFDAPSMIVSDGADHVRYRRQAAKAFTPRAVTALTGRVEEMAETLLDRMARDHGAGGTADLVADYAGALPVLVIAEILGVPAAMQDTFLRWGERIVPLADLGVDYRTYRRAEAGMREMHAWLLGHFERLRRDPGEDLLSRLIVAAAEDKATERGGGLTGAELSSLAGLLLFAGFETTVNLIGSGAVRLMGDPERVALLRDDPAAWRNAIEELLRLDGPLQFTVRYPVRDTQVHGVDVPRGKFVALLLAGANRDPAVFADPDTFDIARPNAREHLAFSAGAHFCVGAALARLEAEVGLRMLFDRFPSMAPAGAPRLTPTRNLRGYARVPVRLDAAVPARR